MTRLYNLESYSELCAYANLYEKKVESSLAAYKNFLDKYKKQGYCSNSIHPKELNFRDDLIREQHLGIELSKDNNNLYIIPDRINSLSLSNILNPGEDYIYKSVYHYWNYRHQIANNINLNKPVVIIDLNSLSNESYCLLEFKKHEKTIYYIPIIDNRTERDINFKLSRQFWDIHNNIYYDLAQEILARNFPKLAHDNNNIESLKSYLQKIEIFKIAQSQTDSDNFSVIAEISYQEKVYYKSVTLDISLLENIIINRIDIQVIAIFANQHPGYSFILISDYNFLAKFKEAFNNSNIFIPDNRLTKFPQIWLEKQQQNFPLFGQYLDKIKFQIKKDGKEQWIEVLSEEEQEHIYYEGESETKEFIARIQETRQDYFKLSYPYNVLPIQINEQDYCLNGKIQEYKITHPWSELKAKSEELIVRIEFIVKLGSVPKLRVRDKDNKYKIAAKLCDRVKIIQLVDHIPWETIKQNRRQKNCFVPSPEKCQQFIDALSPIKNINSIKEAIKFRNNIEQGLSVIHRPNRNTDLFLNINCDNLSVEQSKKIIKSLNNSGMLNTVIQYIEKPSNSGGRNLQEKAKDFVKRFILFIGKFYKLSDNLDLQPFFEPQFIESAYQKVGGEYFLFLSRVALTKEFKLIYFKLFVNLWSRNQPLYQLEEFLWGYSRILLWYFEFDSKVDINYKEHFTKILSYLLTGLTSTGKKLTQGYKQNAFLSLIYLLTFREPSLEQEFCAPESKEYQLAEQVVNKYRSDPVKMKAIPDKPLNEYFEDLLKGNSSQEVLNQLLEADL